MPTTMVIANYAVSRGFRHQARIYVMSSSGGTPEQIRPDFAGAADPIWSPDGKHLLFLGIPDISKPPQDAIDWYVHQYQADRQQKQACW